jgi:hypothetical protein
MLHFPCIQSKYLLFQQHNTQYKVTSTQQFVLHLYSDMFQLLDNIKTDVLVYVNNTYFNFNMIYHNGMNFTKTAS